MEEWQINYLETQHGQLVEHIICNETLLEKLSSYDVLAEVDLESIRSHSVRTQQARALLEIMETRKDGYVAFVKALADSNQTKALEILLQGYAYCLAPDISINFLGQVKPLSEYLSDSEIEHLIGKACEDASANLHENLIEIPHQVGKTMALVSDLVHSPTLPYYIPRLLFKRLVINQKIFQMLCEDVFVFKGTPTIQKLNDLIQPHVSSRSGLQLTKMNTRFIQLESDEHWNNLVGITTEPIHLIKYEEDTKTCVLEKTLGGSKIIYQYLEGPQISECADPNTLLTEDNFVRTICSSSSTGVCICDSPGMGKSFLLATVASKVAEKYPERLVAFIQLQHFMEYLSQRGFPHTVDNVYSRDAILRYICTTSVAKNVLDCILTKKCIPVELFLDGFDEVPPKHFEVTKKMLREFTKFPNTRVYVTSRPHLRHALEECLGAISYDILPFSEDNQIDFLTTLWKYENKECNERKLRAFAKHSLLTVTNSFTRRELCITGIPLVCRLVAQVYSRSAKRYSRSAHSTLVEDSCKLESLLPKLYQRYVEQCFQKAHNTSDTASADVKSYHIWLSLRLLFPEIQEAYFQQHSASLSPQIKDLSISMGILEARFTRNGETIEFVHRTFAEYFASEFFALSLEPVKFSPHWSPGFTQIVTRFLLENSMMTRNITEDEEDMDEIFSKSAVMCFLNFFTEELSFTINNQQLSTLFPVLVSPIRLHALILGCLRESHMGIFKLLEWSMRHLDANAMKQFKKLWLHADEAQSLLRLVMLGSAHSSYALMKHLFTCFLECFNIDLVRICENIPVDMDTPLHFAIERADVELVQFFLKTSPIKNRQILLNCVLSSNDDAPEVVKRKAEICRLLLNHNKELCNETSYTLHNRVHVKLLKVLIEAGTDPRAVKSGKTIVHHAVQYMPGGDFQELCCFLVEVCKAQDLFKPNEPKWGSPLHAIFRFQDNLQVSLVKLLLNISGINVDETDGRGNTVFLIAIQQNQNIEVLRTLVKAGADVNAINIRKENALLLAAKTGNLNALLFLLEFCPGIDYCHQNEEGSCFLHLLNWQELSGKAFHRIISLLAFLGQTNVLHIKNTNQSLPIHLAVRNVDIWNDTLQLFKSEHVDFSTTDSHGWSILMHAVAGKQKVGILKSLIEMGCNVMAADKDENTFAHMLPESYSAKHYHQIVQLLLENGHTEIFQGRNKLHQTPLHLAVVNIELFEETLNLIGTAGVDINSQDEKGHSVLMYAGKGKRSKSFIKLLLEMGADVMTQSKDGKTFAHLAPLYYRHSAETFHQILDLLFEKKLERVFLVKDEIGMYPLHWAVIHMQLLEKTLALINEKLLQRNILDINSKSEKGHTILTLAAIGNSPSVAIVRNTPLEQLKWSSSFPNFLRDDMEIASGSSKAGAKWDAKHVGILIEMGADITVQDNDGNTLLHVLTFYYSPEEYHDIVKLVIEKGLEKVFVITNACGYTCFHMAVAFLELLPATLDLINTAVIKPGILNINVTNVAGESLLSSAAERKRSVNLLATLMDMGVDVMSQDALGNTFAHLIAMKYSPEEYHNILELLLDRGLEKVFTVANKSGATPFLMTTLHLELLPKTLHLISCKLIQTGIVNINPCGGFGGFSQLMFAVMSKRSVRIIKGLIKMGVDVMTLDQYRNTFIHFMPTHYSAEEYHEIISALIEDGKEEVLQIANGNGATLLHIALKHLELLKKTFDLIFSTVVRTNIVNINSTDNDGNSLLHCAVRNKRSVNCLKSLMEMGVNVALQNEDGNTFLHEAASNYNCDQYHAIVELLLEKGFGMVLNAVNKRGMTPLHVAVFTLELRPETVDLFVASYISLQVDSLYSTAQENTNVLNEVDENGNSVLHCALIGKKSLQLVKHLVDLGADWSKKNKHNHNMILISAAFCSAEHVKYFVELGCTML